MFQESRRAGEKKRDSVRRTPRPAFFPTEDVWVVLSYERIIFKLLQVDARQDAPISEAIAELRMNAIPGQAPAVAEPKSASGYNELTHGGVFLRGAISLLLLPAVPHSHC